MNNKVILAFCTLLLSSVVPLLQAETYSWTDEQGTVNFTEDRAAIPKKYRKKIKKYGDVSSPPPVALEHDRKERMVSPLPKTSEAANTTSLFAGKSYEQWKRELAEREGAMSQLRSRIEELDRQIKQGGTARGSGQALVEERRVLIDQHEQLSVIYDQQVEDARKAGLKIEMK